MDLDEERSRDLLFEYNCLTDKHLQGYFSSAPIQKHLQDMGLITRNGRLVPEREYQRQWVKKQQQMMARRMLVRSLANQTREYEINRQLELQRQLDAVRKVETYRKVRGSAAYDNQQPLMHVPPIALERSLTRSHSSPGFRHLRRSAQLPETLGNAEVNNGGPSDAENNLEPIGQRRNSETAAEDERPVLTADIKERQLKRYLEDVYKYSYLHKLDPQSLRMYRNHLVREIQRIRGIRQSFELEDNEEIFYPTTAQSGLTPLPPVHPRMVGIDGRKSFSPTRLPSRGRALWTHETLKSAVSRPTTRGRKLSPMGKKSTETRTQMGRIYVTSAAIRKKQNSSCQCFLQFLGSNANINSDGTEAEIVINKVAVVQQHCGGGQISLFQGELKAGDKFKFFSQRHVGYPFSLLFYINDIVVTKINTCCEARYKVKTRLGGKQGHFRWLGVKKAYPCHKCQVDRNLQPLYSNCQTKSDESSNSAAASLHRRLEKPHKFSEKASDIRGRPRKRKDQNVQPTPEATSIVTVTQMPILHNPDILSHEGNQMIVDKPSSASSKPDLVNHQPTTSYQRETPEEVVEVKQTVNYSSQNSMDSSDESSSSSYTEDSETDYGEAPKVEEQPAKPSENTNEVDTTDDFFDEPEKKENNQQERAEEVAVVEMHDDSDNESKPETHKTEDSDMKVEAESIASRHSQARSITPVLAEAVKPTGDREESSNESESESSDEELEINEEKQQEIAEKLRAASALILEESEPIATTSQKTVEEENLIQPEREDIEIKADSVQTMEHSMEEEKVKEAEEEQSECGSECESESQERSEEEEEEESEASVETKGEEQSLAVSVNEKEEQNVVDDIPLASNTEVGEPIKPEIVKRTEISPSPTASTIRNADSAVSQKSLSSARQSSAASSASRISDEASKASRPPSAVSQKSSRIQSAVSDKSSRSQSAKSFSRPPSSQQPKVQIIPASIASEPPGIEKDEETDGQTAENDNETLSVSRTSHSRTKNSVESSKQSLQSSITTESGESSEVSESNMRKISEESGQSEGSDESDQSKFTQDRNSMGSAQSSNRSASASTVRKKSDQTASDAEVEDNEEKIESHSVSNRSESAGRSKSDLNEGTTEVRDKEELEEADKSKETDTLTDKAHNIEIIVKAPSPLLQIISASTTPSPSPRPVEDHRWFSLDESHKAVPIIHGETEADAMEEKAIVEEPTSSAQPTAEINEETDAEKFTSHLSDGLEEGLKEEENLEQNLDKEVEHHVHFEEDTTVAVAEEIDNVKQTKIDRLTPDLAALCALDDVTITNRNLNLAEIESIGAVLSLRKNIRSLNLRSVGLDDDGVRILADSLQDNTSLIKVITLNSNQITDEGVPDLIKILQKKPIEILQVSDNCLADDGIVALLKNLNDMELANGRILTRIDLGENGVGDDGAAAVGHYLSENDHLQKLSLSGSTEVTEAGWNAIAEGIQNNRKLQVLSFDYCKMGNSACSALCRSLKGNSTLRSLDLEGNDLSESCVAEIIEMIRSCTEINNVCLTAGNNIGTDSLTRVRQILIGKQPGASEDKDLLSVSSAMTR